MTSLIRKVNNTRSDSNEGSFQLILPKEWCDLYELKHGDTLELHLDEIGPRTILLQFPNEDSTTQPTELTLNDRDHTTGQARRRAILGGYLEGYDKIILENVSRVSSKRLKIREDIQILTQKLDGCFTNEEEDQFELQISSSDRTPLDLLEKLYSTTKLMLEDVFRAYLEWDLTLSKDLIQRDDQADKLYFSIVRTLKLILRQPFRYNNQIELVNTLDYRMVASNLENLCDACEYVAQAIRGENEDLNNINEEEVKKLRPADRNLIADIAESLITSLKESYNYYLESNEQQAVEMSAKRPEMNKYLSNLTAIGIHGSLLNVIDEAIETIVDLLELVHANPED